MSQIFHHSSNTLARITLYGAVFFIGFLGWAGYELDQSHWATRQKVPTEQTVPFSHKHHVAGIGIDCRYCHTTVETSSFANIPPTRTCMNCHSQIWLTSPELEPVRASFRTGQSIRWARVYDLPDYVYFNHSIHVNKGVGCSSCHGRVDQMPLLFQANSLLMEWCLDCHRDPEKALRPLDKVYDMAWTPGANQAELGKKYHAERNIRSTAELISCSTCHR